MLNDVIYFKQTTHIGGSSVASDGTRGQCDSRRPDVEASSAVVLMDDMPFKTRKEMDENMMKKKNKKRDGREDEDEEEEEEEEGERSGEEMSE